MPMLANHIKSPVHIICQYLEENMKQIQMNQKNKKHGCSSQHAD